MSTTRLSRVLHCIGPFSAVASLVWLAACAAKSDANPPSSSGAGASPAGSSAGGAAQGGASNGAAGALVSGGSNSAGAFAANGGATTGGGAPPAGGASTGTAGAGVGGAATLPSPAGFFAGGFLMRTPWLGYTFTIVDALGSTVSPVCTTTGCLPDWGDQPCAKGTVAKDAASASFAGLAFHANDPMAGPRGTWTSTGTGVFISVSNPPASARLQLQEQVATNDTRYCAPLPAGGTGLIPWASFKTYCWGDVAHPSKVFTVGTAIHEVTVIVPGNSTAAQIFDFCLADIQPR